MSVEGNNSPASAPKEEKRLQFSVLQLLAFATFAGLLLGVLAIGYQANAKARQLRNQVFQLRQQNEELQLELQLNLGDKLRAEYAEKILFHVHADPDKYPDLQLALKGYHQRKVGVSLHGLGEDDNLTYLNFYSMEDNETSQPFCHSFLVQEKPFLIFDYIQGEQPRSPRINESKWTCGAGKDGRDRWFVIENKEFKLLKLATTANE